MVAHDPGVSDVFSIIFSSCCRCRVCACAASCHHKRGIRSIDSAISNTRIYASSFLSFQSFYVDINCTRKDMAACLGVWYRNGCECRSKRHVYSAIWVYGRCNNNRNKRRSCFTSVRMEPSKYEICCLIGCHFVSFIVLFFL